MLKKMNVLKIFFVGILSFYFLFGQEEGNSSTSGGSDDPKYDMGVSLFTYGKYQRFSFSPMVSVWKFNFQFDLEFFLDLEKNNIAWEKTFDTRSIRSMIDSVFRKIRYFGFSTREEVVWGKDIFHIGAGSLQNITLGTGILVNRFLNTYRYPIEKNLGLTVAFNSQTEFKIGFEAFSYNLKDLMASSSGVLGGGRVFINPVKFFQIGVGGVIDSNQLSALQDTDEDGYPDDAEFFPNDKNRFSQKDKIKSDLLEQGFEESTVETFLDSKDDYINIFKVDGQQDSIAAISVDAVILLEELISLPLVLYSHGAVLVDDDDLKLNPELNTKAEGFGVGVGTTFSAGNTFRFSLEYRHSQKNFRFSLFDDYYSVNRAQIAKNLPITGDNLLEDRGVANGALGKLFFNLFDIALLTSDYELMINSDSKTSQRLSASFQVNEIFKKVPVINHIEAFYKNNRIEKVEDLHKNNRFLFYGYKIGLNLSGIDVSYVYQVDWIEDIEGNLSQNPIFKVEIGKSY